MQDLINAFDFISKNIHMAGWVFLIVCSVKLTFKITTFLNGLEDAKKTLDTVATNHLPHIEASLVDLTNELKNLRETVITIVLSHKI